MDTSNVTITVRVEQEQDLGGATTFRASAHNDHGDTANGKSTHSPALAAGEAIGNLIDAFH